MPGISVAVWFPVVTLAAGYALKYLGDWVLDRRTSTREREARAADRSERLLDRRRKFQRKTLLELQEVLMMCARAAMVIHHQDQMAFRDTGRWQKQLTTNDASETFRAEQARLTILTVRVHDQSIRHLANQFKAHCVDTNMSESKESSQHEALEMSATFDVLNEKIGDSLRKLDDDEDHTMTGLQRQPRSK